MTLSLKKIRNYYNWGARYLTDSKNIKGNQLNSKEALKEANRTIVLNLLIEQFKFSNYLEIGVRNPADNFDLINCKNKYSVDPGVEFKENPVDFQLTSDEFFEAIKSSQHQLHQKKFDVIFIDGLHLAEQVSRDILNSKKILSENGFIVLHDCNPPTEWHAREDYYYDLTPAKKMWNGTTWKAFFKERFDKHFGSLCIDSDWGIGLISERIPVDNPPLEQNHFYEFFVLSRSRKNALNLISFEEFSQKIKQW